MAGTVYTIGHSNQTVEELLHLLHIHQIAVLVDVRSAPYSRWATQFNVAPLREALPPVGVKYLYLGKELGGRPEGAQFYDAEGHVLYDRVAVSPLFMSGVERLERGMAAYRVAMMCSEEDPTGCHRRLLVGRVLAGRGADVLHIRGDGRLQTEEELAQEEAGAAGAAQPSLFDLGEVTPWRSIRSVLHKDEPPTSSPR